MPRSSPRPARLGASPRPATSAGRLERAFEALLVLVSASALFALLLGVSGDSRARAGKAALAGPSAPVVKVAEAERDGQLRVKVVGREGQGVPGALVRLYWERDRRYFDAGQASTERDGEASILRVPRGSLWVLAEAAGYARASTQVVMEGGARDVSLALTPATELAVKVTDEAHAVLPGATVLVTGSDPLPFGALTDEQGLARLGRLGAPPFTIKASAPGYESITRNGVSSSVEIALRRLGTIEVHVKHADGTPAPGASVEIGGPTLWPARSTQADAAGTCKISGLLAGSYDLRATRAEWVSRVLMGLTLERGQDQQVTLTLEPGRFVTALVTDGAGPNPHLVADADVVLAEEGLSSFPLRGRSGSDGKVRLGPISSGPATLSGRARDFVGSAVVAVPDRASEPIRLALLRGGTLLGEVVDARGFPIGGASVEIIGEGSGGLPIAETPELLRFRRSHFNWAFSAQNSLISSGELGVMPGPVPPIPGSHAALQASAFSAQPASLDADADAELTAWITDSGGRFRAAPVTPGRVRALVRHPDYVEGVSAAVTLDPGGQALVKLTLLHGGSLEGRVKDDHDQPIAGAEIEVLAEHGTFQRSTVTASDGSFAFSALPRELIVNVRRSENPARIAKRLTLSVDEGQRQTIDITLAALREPLRLTVTDDADAPLELAEVNVLSLDPTTPLRATAFSDAAGKLEISDAQGLPLRISVQAPGFARSVRVVGASEAKAALVLKLSPGALVEGRITALRGRRSVQGALVTLSFQGLRRTATTDADGLYRMSDVAVGPVTLRVSHPDFAEAESSSNIDNPGRRDRAFELPAIDLEEPGDVEGEVQDERGDPVAGARVAVGRAPSYLPAGVLPRGVALTDARGGFTLRGLPSGMTTLDVFSPSRGRGSIKVEVRANRTQSGLRITLRPSDSEPEPFAPGGVAVTLGERGAGEKLEIVVVSVAENSEAERAGVEAGDVVLAINEAKPGSMHDARARLSGPLQSDVVLSLGRNGSVQRLSVLREAVRK